MTRSQCIARRSGVARPAHVSLPSPEPDEPLGGAGDAALAIGEPVAVHLPGAGNAPGGRAHGGVAAPAASRAVVRHRLRQLNRLRARAQMASSRDDQRARRVTCGAGRRGRSSAPRPRRRRGASGSGAAVGDAVRGAAGGRGHRAAAAAGRVRRCRRRVPRCAGRDGRDAGRLPAVASLSAARAHVAAGRAVGAATLVLSLACGCAPATTVGPRDGALGHGRGRRVGDRRDGARAGGRRPARRVHAVPAGARRRAAHAAARDLLFPGQPRRRRSRPATGRARRPPRLGVHGSLAVGAALAARALHVPAGPLLGPMVWPPS